MRLLTMLAAAGLGYAAYALLTRRAGGHATRRPRLPEPYAHGAGDGAFIRPSGPEQMSAPPRTWDEVDEALDETFPASDPVARY